MGFSAGRFGKEWEIFLLSAGNSDDCLPLTGVIGSLREATVAASSSLSSGMEVVSSVRYCVGEEEALE